MDKYQNAIGVIKACGLNIKGSAELLEDVKQIENTIIEALEKQMPKKVKYLNRHGIGCDLYNKDYFNCPSCGRRLRNKQKDNHCGRCGQALDWSDTNDR